MRIQHNIMALNAYRNYNTNTSALSKNLEKLSSGYKINRAGDDAAGLAISEKMRAQITGLNAAQKNVKDGISLVKTAEGAMQEIQDMLNRMDYLATQSANGTYDNEVDRANLQKEVDQLLDEIDRIAESSNFNGIKLLDGSLDTGAKAASTTWSDPADVSIGNAGQAHQLATTTVGHALRTDGVDRQDPTFTVDLTNVEFNAETANGFTINIGGVDIDVTKGADGTTALKKGDKLSGENLAKAIAAAVNATATTVKGTKAADATESAVLNGLEIDGLVYKASVEGSSVKFELQTADKDGAAILDQELKNDGTATIEQQGVTITDKAGDGTDGTFTGLDAMGHANTKINIGVAEKAGDLAHATIDLTGKIKDGTKLTIGDKTYVFQVGKDSKVTEAGDGEVLIDMKDVEADDAQLVDKAIAKLTNQENTWFRLESGKTGLLTAVEKVGTDGKPVYAGTGDITTTAGLQSNFQISQMTYTAADPGDASKSLQLQIGDTSDSYNQLQVKVGDMHRTALGLNGLNIGTAKDASNAIQKIKNAINQVSSVRGDLGATQNRLEHTANNLSVMAENIQDAESTIRDTDVAEEMMAYTKNNILVQSAQAMLAQANAVPQGVLQLLG